MAKVRQIPMRMCLACRQMRPKNELLRIVRTPQGQVTVDNVGKVNGRGAYLCKTSTCLNKCIKSNALARQLDCEIDSTVIETIKRNITE